MIPQVLAAISIATTFAQMFGPKRYSLADLLAIQTEMLKNISSQLELIIYQKYKIGKDLTSSYFLLLNIYIVANNCL